MAGVWVSSLRWRWRWRVVLAARYVGVAEYAVMHSPPPINVSRRDRAAHTNTLASACASAWACSPGKCVSSSHNSLQHTISSAVRRMMARLFLNE